MPYLSCKKIENDVYNFPTWQYCKYKDIFDSRIIINSTAKFYISISYQKDLLSIDTRIFTPSIVILGQICFLVLEAPEPSFNHDIVSPAAFTIHALTDLVLFEKIHVLIACKLTALIRIQDNRFCYHKRLL